MNVPYMSSWSIKKKILLNSNLMTPSVRHRDTATGHSARGLITIMHCLTLCACVHVCVGPAELSTLITRDITKRLSAYEMAGAKCKV